MRGKPPACYCDRGDVIGSPALGIRQPDLDGPGEATAPPDPSAGHQGRFLRALGRSGEGPGEFADLTDVFVREDTLLAWDARQGRVTVFGPDGGVVRTVSIRPSPDGRRSRPVGVLSDGSFVVRAEQPVMAGQTPGGVRRDSARIALHGPGGEPVRTVATIHGDEVFVVRQGRSTSVTDLPFPHRGVASARGDRIVVASTDAYRLDVRDGSGAPVLSVEAPVRPALLTEEILEAARSREVAHLREIGFWERMRANVEAKYDAMPRGRPLPVLSEVLVAADGRVWVRLADPAAPTAQTWAVHDLDGPLLHTVRLPDRVRLMDAGAERALGLLTDDLGVHHVGVWRLGGRGRTP